MQKFHAALFAAVVVLTAAATSLAVAAFFQARSYGVSLPQGPAVFETSLQSRISASDTSMTLVANSVRGGSTQCFTIDKFEALGVTAGQPRDAAGRWRKTVGSALKRR